MTEIQPESVECTDDNGIDIEDDGFEFPDDNEITDMLDEVPLDTELASVTDRYFTPFYKVNVQKPNDDICIRIHSNRICMLTLAPSHPVLQAGVKIQSISFKVTEKLDRAANKVSGKGKHGAQPLQESSNICIITCNDGEKWNIKCCMMGKLIEVNEGLVDNPEMIREKLHKGGYFAIVLPNIKVYEDMKKTLLSEKDYQKVLSEREKNKNKVTDDGITLNTGKRVLEENSNDSGKEKIQKV